MKTKVLEQHDVRGPKPDDGQKVDRFADLNRQIADAFGDFRRQIDEIRAREGRKSRRRSLTS